ncbi:MAG: ATP synthase F0 subunit B [Elusimicrobia bacterium RIFOXYA2_FULL_50_26]|nr:MAG: ATP synthase F0 subunit B [Elusimicrobia bacterium RIFOXYA2_FULL_50_26]OGS23415.1 MAG: ATP synthase F0 subunit B [Elusimicrobia bacterium RIFOXYB2_FULL_50_12]
MIDINLSILAAQVVTFLIALFIIWKISWKPLTEMMSRRQEKIKNDIEAAQAQRQSAEELKKTYEKHLADARVEAHKLVALASEDAQRERQAILVHGRAEAEKIVGDARRELEQEKIRLVGELRRDVSMLAVEISEKMVRKSIDPAVQEQAFKEAMDSLDKQ